MESEQEAYETGMSGITGTLVRIRHANEADRYFIEQALQSHGLDADDLVPEDFVVATEDERLLGFGRLRRVGQDSEIDSVVVDERRRGAGIGSMIVQHLLEYAPTGRIFVVTDRVGFFTRLGFSNSSNSEGHLRECFDPALRTQYNERMTVLWHKKK